MSDPVVIVWDALVRGGWGPRGPMHNFRARCPAHDGDNPTALHVSDDGDGNALLCCFAHRCSAERICAALGLRVADLFHPDNLRPLGRRLDDARRCEFDGEARVLANVLLALSRLGVEHRAEVVTDCPYCRAPSASLTVATWFDGVLVQCERGCGVQEFTEALAGRLSDQRREAE